MNACRLIVGHFHGGIRFLAFFWAQYFAEHGSAGRIQPPADWPLARLGSRISAPAEASPAAIAHPSPWTSRSRRQCAPSVQTRSIREAGFRSWTRLLPEGGDETGSALLRTGPLGKYVSVKRWFLSPSRRVKGRWFHFNFLRHQAVSPRSDPFGHRILKRCFSPRMKRVPSAGAGDASVFSPISFVARTSNVRLCGSTNVLPSSF